MPVSLSVLQNAREMDAESQVAFLCPWIAAARCRELCQRENMSYLSAMADVVAAPFESS
jgi:hypothetical protein